MRDIVELCSQFQSSVSAEANRLVREGLIRRNVLEERAAELRRRRDLELSNIDEWTVLQKAMVANLFESLLDAVRDDEELNENSLARLVDDADKKSKRDILAGQRLAGDAVVLSDEHSVDDPNT